MTSNQIDIKQDVARFPIREDANGARAVFLLGNERDGGCPYKCAFCNVRDLPGSSSEENQSKFRSQYDSFKEELEDRKYHALMYNEGNCTNEDELSRETLDNILETFNDDEAVSFVSLNSREEQATSEVLDYLANKKLNYPIHFILGQESFSERASRVLGKRTSGSLGRFVEKLRNYNQRDSAECAGNYVFGLDINLVFLPELYLEEGERREGNESKVREGIKEDLRRLLQHVNSDVPIEINIHCYSRVSKLPHESADYRMLLQIAPELQEMVKEQNRSQHGCETHIFLGQFYAERTPEGYVNHQAVRINELTANFNKTGKLRGK